MKEDLKWQEVRDLYPALSESVYLTTAAVAPLSKNVFEANLNHLKMMHLTGDLNWQASVEKMHELRQTIADFIACNPNDLAFGHNTSLNMNYIAMIYKDQFGVCEIVTLEEEFPSTVLPWMHHGFNVKKLKLIDMANAEDEILLSCSAATKIVVVSHQQFSSGLKLNLKYLGQNLRAKNIVFVVNATQSLGIFPIDCEESNIAALTASCHKWMGIGYGLSLLYIKEFLWKSCRWPVYGWLSQDEENFMSHTKLSPKKSLSVLETGVPNFQLVYSLDSQIKFLDSISQNEIAQRVVSLARFLKAQLSEQKFQLESFDDKNDAVESTKNSGTILIKLPDAEAVEAELANRKVYVSVRGGGLRVSISYYNNEQDVLKFVESLKQICKKPRA